MFNFLNVSDAKGLWPIVILAAVGVAGWYVWTKSKQTAMQDNSGASAVTAGNTTTVADLALLQSLMAGGGTTGNLTSPSRLSMSQPTYGFTGSNAPAATAPTTSGSSTGNTFVTQGAG